MTLVHRLLVACAIVQASAAFAADPVDPASAPAPACTPSGPVTPICGASAPEDLELLPGGRQLLVSQMPGHSAGQPGGLAVLDIASGAIRPLPVRSRPSPAGAKRRARLRWPRWRRTASACRGAAMAAGSCWW